jgi:hypothetical protein
MILCQFLHQDRIAATNLVGCVGRPAAGKAAETRSWNPGREPASV